MPGKLVYLDWIYEVARKGVFGPHEKSDVQKEIIGRVRDAVDKLSPVEREFVQMYWFEGRSLKEVSELLGKRLHNLDGINRRVLRKLKRILSEYVAARFGIIEPNNSDCIICNHPDRREIDRLLIAKKPDETYRPIYRQLRSRFGLRISTPQILIGHIKYHTNSGEYHE
jgi:hypothetical protein